MKYYHEKFPIVKDMISVLYEYCCTGGCCHIVTDDGNIYDDDLDFVIEYAQRDENKDRIDSELSVAICNILKTMTFLQRAVLFDSMEFGIPYYNQEDFDDFYPHDEECLKSVLKEYDWRNEFEFEFDCSIKLKEKCSMKCNSCICKECDKRFNCDGGNLHTGCEG